MDKKLLQLRIVFRRIIQSVIVISIFAMAVTNINNENDIFWQLKLGEQIVINHNFPTHDIYSSSAAGAVWTLHEWLPSVIFYLTYSRLGAGGLILLKAGVVALTFGLILFLFNRMKVNLYLSLLVFALAALVNTRGVWVVFPSIFEYLFLVLALIFLETYREKKKQIFILLLIILSLIWANSHGSFFILPMLAGAYWFGDILIVLLKKIFKSYNPIGARLTVKQRKSLFAVTVISLITPLITPSTYWTWLYPFRISFGKFTPYVSEYQGFLTAWHWNWSDYILTSAFVLAGFLILLFIISRKKLHPADLIIGIIFIALPFSAIRHIAIFALVAVFLIAKYISVWFGEYRGIFKRILVKDVWVLIIIVCFTYFYKTNVIDFGLKLSEDGYPKGAAEFLNSSGIPGNMFNHYNYGGYLIWKMPDYKVFIDGRLEMYEGQVGQDYQSIIDGRDNWETLADKYKINFFLDYLTDGVVQKLINSPDWKYIDNDSGYVIFVRNSPENKNIIAKYWSQDSENQFKIDFASFINGQMLDYYNKEGIKAAKAGNNIMALYYFQQGVAIAPDSIPLRMNLADIYLQIGNTDEAKKEYNTILQLDPNNSQAKSQLKTLELYKLPLY